MSQASTEQELKDIGAAVAVAGLFTADSVLKGHFKEQVEAGGNMKYTLLINEMFYFYLYQSLRESSSDEAYQQILNHVVSDVILKLAKDEYGLDKKQCEILIEKLKEADAEYSKSTSLTPFEEKNGNYPIRSSATGMLAMRIAKLYPDIPYLIHTPIISLSVVDFLESTKLLDKSKAFTV